MRQLENVFLSGFCARDVSPHRSTFKSHFPHRAHTEQNLIFPLTYRQCSQSIYHKSKATNYLSLSLGCVGNWQFVFAVVRGFFAFKLAEDHRDKGPAQPKSLRMDSHLGCKTSFAPKCRLGRRNEDFTAVFEGQGDAGKQAEGKNQPFKLKIR